MLECCAIGWAEKVEAEIMKPGLRMRTERIRRGKAWEKENRGRMGWLLNLPGRC